MLEILPENQTEKWAKKEFPGVFSYINPKENGGMRMVFSSTVFLFLFLPAVLLIYYNPIVKTRTFRNVFLLLASLAFYAWGEPIFVFLMILSIFITWYIGLKIQKKHNKNI